MSAQGPVRATVKENTRLDWETPKPFFNWRNSIWRFDVDAAASRENSLLGLEYLGERSLYAEDALGLDLDWSDYGERFWVNPPYGRGVIDWVAAFYRQAQNGVFVEALLPANTGTLWFKYCQETASQIELLTGRIGFWKNGKPMPPKEDANTSDSMLVRWHRGVSGSANIRLTDWKEEMADA